MIHTLMWEHPTKGSLSVVLRKPEIADLEALYAQKNNPRVARALGGFSLGYARRDIEHWIEHHRTHPHEALWAIIAGDAEGPCVGHVGLYEIDHRIRSAEFAVMVGDPDYWRKGIGREVTLFALRYGFEMLNLNRIQLSVLGNNEAAQALYASIGFHKEGVQRQAQYKDGEYIDVVLMSVLREEYEANAP